MHVFSMENRDDFLRRAKTAASTYVGVTLVIGAAAITRETFDTNRLGLYKDDESITSLAEFRYAAPQTRARPVRSPDAITLR